MKKNSYTKLTLIAIETILKQRILYVTESLHTHVTITRHMDFVFVAFIIKPNNILPQETGLCPQFFKSKLLRIPLSIFWN